MKAQISSKRVTLNVKIIEKKAYSSNYGEFFIVKLVDDKGLTYRYKGNTPPDFEDFKSITATVKTEIFNGIEMIYLQRISIVGFDKKAAKLEKLEAQRLQLEAIRVKEEQERKELDEKIRQRKEKELEWINSSEFTSLLGKTISMIGWSYDNGGSLCGVIESIEWTGKEVRVTVNKDTRAKDSMISHCFNYNHWYWITKNGRYESSRLSNWGINAHINDFDKK
jgi:hypothetical protein